MSAVRDGPRKILIALQLHYIVKMYLSKSRHSRKKDEKNLQSQGYFLQYNSDFVMVVPQNLRFPFC